MEDLTIKSCKNNVCTYLTKMQETRNEIDSLQKDRTKYDKQRFLTLTFNTSTFIADMINLYSN